MLRLLALLFLIPGIALAQEESSTYSPEFCEFGITFPEEPYKTRRCEDEDETRCYDQMSYTKVFELSSTVNFRVICNEVGENVRISYNGDIMQATLRAMTERSTVETFETSFRETDTYKQAGLVGQGQSGTLPTIYIAQLWIGDKSAFSVEAELIGDASEDADTLFSEILKSAGFIDKSEPKEEETKPKDSPAEPSDISTED